MKLRRYEKGNIQGSVIAMVLLGLAVVVLIGLSIWLFVQYSDQKNNVDSKVDEDEKKFSQREKEPNREFIGPDDYGRLTFSYPKTWSVYVASATTNSSSGAFKAYLNPGFVPSTEILNQRFAVRVVIVSMDFDKAVAQYDVLVKKGDLKISQTSANGQAGTRLDGNFSKDIRGAVVMYKVRDKTVSVFTDADTFKPDFENIIKTIKFNE
jgi:hypothetical protein